jgi:PKD repeat protein
VLDAEGNLVRGPLPVVEYLGSGRGTAVGLAAGPDGLYFTDLYKDFGASTPTEPGASVFRIVWTGIADFTAEPTASGQAPLAVEFRDASNVPSATAWHWEFGDGETSDEREPVHVYRVAGGAYDVRLTVTGARGAVSRQKASFVAVQPADRRLEAPSGGRPSPRVVTPK